MAEILLIRLKNDQINQSINTLLVFLSQKRHLSTGNITMRQEEADDDRCCLEVPKALAIFVKDVDFLFAMFVKL